MSQPQQRRILATTIPGPKSLKLQEQRDLEVAGGLGSTMPVFVDRAGGGILVDVDGNHIIDLASGIAVTSVGASDRRSPDACASRRSASRTRASS